MLRGLRAALHMLAPWYKAEACVLRAQNKMPSRLPVAQLEPKE
jgi:hypothetical protein